MRCEAYQGIGMVTYDELPQPEKLKVGFGSVFPCPSCNGCGVAHCCEGLREQLETGDDNSRGR